MLARMRTLSTIDVSSRASCTTSGQRLRRYVLSYLPDADTQQPRLSSVQMFGREGTAEENTSVPVASYGYGSASNAGERPDSRRRLTYQKTYSIPFPPGADSTKISSTLVDDTGFYVTWQSLTDVTGDGRPDLVFKKDGKLWVARNLPSTGGSSIFGDVGPLSDATLSSGAFEQRFATNNRFNYINANIDQVWRQAIDVNGDGRIDIIDAAEEPGHWVVYLNTPGPGPSGVTWVRRSISIAELYHHMYIRGLNVQDNYVPLASRYTGHDQTVGACWIYQGTQWLDYPQGFGAFPCGVYEQNSGVLGPEKTYTEWDLWTSTVMAIQTWSLIHCRSGW